MIITLILMIIINSNSIMKRKQFLPDFSENELNDELVLIEANHEISYDANCLGVKYHIKDKNVATVVCGE